MCEYTSNGHYGILIDNGYVDNYKTLKYLSKIAVSHAIVGSDIISPSDMMGGWIIAIREALDSDGFVHILIMSYGVKYASTFSGPLFREVTK